MNPGVRRQGLFVRRGAAVGKIYAELICGPRNGIRALRMQGCYNAWQGKYEILFLCFGIWGLELI